MTGEAAPEGTQETGGALRQQLEAALARATASESFAAQQVAARFAHVKPEDLQGVPIDQFEVRANEVSTARAEERQAILRDELTSRGLDEERIAQVLNGATPPPPATQQTNLERLGQLGGTRPERVDFEGLSGPDLIRAAIHQKRGK